MTTDYDLFIDGILDATAFDYPTMVEKGWKLKSFIDQHSSIDTDKLEREHLGTPVQPSGQKFLPANGLLLVTYYTLWCGLVLHQRYNSNISGSVLYDTCMGIIKAKTKGKGISLTEYTFAAKITMQELLDAYNKMR